ncbi:MAG: nucleotidyltransferase family protein [Deltaproteobacteria bacterium]|nr:nucleotidyltransferase family protein [Deltaproteobacteria bacterium]
MRAPLAVTAVLLAAGLSKRFGGDQPKQLHPFRGQPLVRRMATLLAASRAAEVIVVLGHRAEEVGESLNGLPVRRALNRDYDQGQASSVVAGLKSLQGDPKGALFVPCDQPLLTVEVVDSLISAFEKTEAPIVAPAFEGRRGAPTLFSNHFFPQLQTLEGDTGGREILKRHLAKLTLVPVEDPNVLRDADTLEEWAALELLAST